MGEPSKARRTTIICEPDYTPGTRDECPNSLHDHPLPDGYIAASDVAAARLRKRWANVRCPDCGLYGWRPGQPVGKNYEPPAAHRG